MSPFRASALSLAIVLSALAAPATVQAQAEDNWMRTFVIGRVAARNVQSVPPSQRAGRMSAIRRSLEPRIVGGGNATASQNPFQVAILNRSIADNANAQFCGGALVSETQVVTAAHCVDSVVAGDIDVLGNTRSLASGGTRVNVRRIVLHPGWDPVSFDNDAAILDLSAPLSGVQTATLANQDGAVGADLLVTGWGDLSEGGAAPTQLQALNVPLVSRANCNDGNSYDGDITAQMICAGFDAGGRDSCQGDSGGPLTRGAGNRSLTGIVSWGFGCARPNLYGVYTRVSAPAIRRFLDANLNLPAPEDCLGHRLSQLQVRNVGGTFRITQGSRSLMSFGSNRAEADRTLAILRHYGADRRCFIGRPDPSFTYVLAGGAAPAGSFPGEDCIAHDVAGLRVQDEGSRFLVTDGRSRMVVAPNRQEAQDIVDAFWSTGATRTCYVGRPGPSFAYIRR